MVRVRVRVQTTDVNAFVIVQSSLPNLMEVITCSVVTGVTGRDMFGHLTSMNQFDS